MIVINITRSGLTVDGHAGYAKKGNDIVCAAVSMLAQNLVNSLDMLTDDEVICHMQNGHMDIQWKDLSERGRLLVDSFFVGMDALQNTYADHVKIATRA